MTELETLQRAKMYMDKLARGIDPITDREISDDSVLNHVRLARCFFYVSDVLQKVIDNGGEVGARHDLLPFAIGMDQLSAVRISREPVRISQLADSITAAANNPHMKKLSAAVITDWLLEKGFLEKQMTPDGKSRRMPTEAGRSIGLTAETYQGRYGQYQAVYYSAGAQQFVVDNLISILARKESTQTDS